MVDRHMKRPTLHTRELICIAATALLLPGGQASAQLSHEPEIGALSANLTARGYYVAQHESSWTHEANAIALDSQEFQANTSYIVAVLVDSRRRPSSIRWRVMLPTRLTRWTGSSREPSGRNARKLFRLT